MSVHEILSAITEAKVALDREPQLTSRILELERSLNQSQQHAQAIELKLLERNDTIDQLSSKVRSLEVERDDMGFRELEAQDKLDALRNVVNTFTAKANSLVPQVVEVTQAEPISEALPVAPQAGNSTGQPTETEPLHDTSPSFAGMAGEGQSESPLSSATTTQENMTNTSAPSTVTMAEDAPSPKPYEGKTHTQVFGDLRYHITYQEWMAGGGTHDNWNI